MNRESDTPAGNGTPELIHYELEGSGPCLTLVHGVGSCLGSWDGVIAALGPGYRFLRYDLRGHGRSARLPGPYHLDDFVDDLRRLLDRLEIARTHLAGFSLGGLIAQAFALAEPHRVEKLVLISTVAGRTADERERVRQRARTLAEQGATAHLAEAVERWFTADYIAKQKVSGVLPQPQGTPKRIAEYRATCNPWRTQGYNPLVAIQIAPAGDAVNNLGSSYVRSE